MFTKDFLQFSPIIDTSLCSTNIQQTLSLAKLTQKQIIGKRFRENYIHHDNKTNATNQSCSICTCFKNLYN